MTKLSQGSMIVVNLVAPCDITDYLGFIPSFLDEDDPRPAVEQLNANYAHGGGFRPMDGFAMDPRTFVLSYPGDPPFRPLAMMLLRQEQIFVYEHAFVCVVQLDGSFAVSRMD